MNTLYLASNSPRRAELLAQMGVIFSKLAVNVPEVREPGEAPASYVSRLAKDKSRAGSFLKPDSVVLGADTIVVCEGQVLEKPASLVDCVQMLQLLSNNVHEVHTAVALTKGERQIDCLVTSRVHFREISEAEMQAYWHTGEPCDKAGSYGIQGLGGVFVSHLEGSYSGVMGLPVAQTQQLLHTFDIPCWQVPAMGENT